MQAYSVRIRYAAAACLILVPPFLGLIGSCGLGYIDIEPAESLEFRIINAAPAAAEVTITVMSAKLDGEDVEIDDRTGLGKADVTVRVPTGNASDGHILCGEELTITAASGTTSTTIQLTGAGTGTPGFDSGSVGTNGERFLIAGTHYICGDTILIELQSSQRGVITAVAAGEPLPDTSDVGSTADDGTTEPAASDGAAVVFRLENATGTAADITILPDLQDGDHEDLPTGTKVRIPAGEFSMGELACGGTFVVTASIADANESAVMLSGDGTGTAGFDSSSIGLNGERLLAFEEHYACGASIVVRITDDGSGIGPNTSDTATGLIEVFASEEPLPEPNLPDPDAVSDPVLTDEINLVVINSVESTIQVNFATGSGSLADSGGTSITSEFDVRVPPGSSTRGIGACAQEYVVAASHLEAIGTTVTTATDDGLFDGGGNVTFHGVVLTGDGTGTEGFDSNSIAILRGRLLQLGTHFACGDTITIEVIATNNQIELDANGSPVLDSFGNPNIKYNIGVGTVSVTSGQ